MIFQDLLGYSTLRTADEETRWLPQPSRFLLFMPYHTMHQSVRKSASGYIWLTRNRPESVPADTSGRPNVTHS